MSAEPAAARRQVRVAEVHGRRYILRGEHNEVNEVA